MTKKKVAAILENIATLMELSGENPFKTRSYINGARAIETMEEDLETVVAEKRLREIRGVGEALAQKIEELVTTGRLEFYEDLRAQFPPGIFELFGIPGLGPKRIKQVYDALQIDDMEKLEAACKDGRIATLKGFSAKMQEKILEGIAFCRQQQGQHLVEKALHAAEQVLAYLREADEVLQIDYAGSLRRGKEIVKDIDIVCASDCPQAVMQRFVEFPEVIKVTGHGDTKSSVILSSGIAADLRVVAPRQYPYALLHFTGSKEHNVVLRQRAKERGLKLNEYGLFAEGETLVERASETEIYRELGLPFIPAELREDLGEFVLTETPRLLEMNDIVGVIHSHSVYSDGHDTILDMAEACRARGYRYLVMSDHSQSAAYANGLKPDRIAKQHAEIDALNKTLRGFRILKSIESDILANGRLDYTDDVLASFDLVIASVHSKLTMTEAEATARVIKAIEHPATKILGHPTGRLLLERAGYPLDFDKVFDAAIANGVAIEINANAHRLDIDWRYVRRGRDKGVMFSIGPDAHSIEGLDVMRYGVQVARKGWLGPEHVLNTRTADELLHWAHSR